MLIDYIKEIISSSELKSKYASDYSIITEELSSHEELGQYLGGAATNFNLSNSFFKEFLFDKFSKSGIKMDRFTIDPDRVYTFEDESFTLRNNFVLLNYVNESINFFNNDGFSFYTFLNNSVQYAGDAPLIQDLLDKYQIEHRADKVPETSKIRYQKSKKDEESPEVKVSPEVMTRKENNIHKGARAK